eukprot:GEZU01035673.1.p1 GENE.GEZU01035673.1~~GEZU01035673.1.p1  ORF type:complete len:429 (+),score=194.07 GEZU01035673.1:78-1364(+)
MFTRGLKSVFSAKSASNAQKLFKPQQQKRFLNIHEYLGKQLMEEYGVRIQRGKAISNVNEAEAATKAIMELSGSDMVVVKSQILAGGRGKGTFNNGFKGGVKLAKSPEQAKELSSKMLGFRLTTHQTPPEGIEVKKLLIAECIDIKRETYFAIVLDRAAGGPVMVASPRGGMDIEQVAQESPQDIFTEVIDITKGPSKQQTDSLAAKLGFEGKNKENASSNMQKLYNMFINTDATQIEINPWAETPQGEVVAVDAKINFDDNAEFRQKKIFEMRDFSEEDPREVQASKFGLNYIGLDGNIGCMVNGAGLAMATMDIIKLHNGSPANFLDVGGGATTSQVKEAFKILQGDSKVKCILVNIFGGIMRCDVIADGIVQAAREISLSVPVVVRLAGTNVEKGKQILKDSGLNIITADDLDDAASKAVQQIQQ